MPPFRFDPARDLRDPAVRAAYLSDAFASDDPFIVSLALKEIGTVLREPVALDENPPLGEVMRAVRALGLELVVEA